MEVLQNLIPQRDGDQGSVTTEHQIVHDLEIVTVGVVGVQGGRPVCD